MGVIDSSLPLAPDDTKWSASAATKAVKELASDSDGNIDFGVYQKAFFWVDPEQKDKQGGYKLPFATVVDGKLSAVWNGVAAAMGALNGAQGGVNIPEADREPVYKEIGTYYKRFKKEQPDLSKSLKREVGEHVEMVMNIDQSTVKSLGDGIFEATITNSDVDRSGESIDYKGISTDNYMNNPVVLYGHDYTSLPIGKATKLTKSNVNQSWKARFELATKIYPFAATVAEMITAGFLNAVSIGGVVKQWNENYTEILQMEMVEFSIVPVPANAGALITSRSLEKVIGKSTEDVAKEYHQFVQKSVAEKVKGFDTSEVKSYIDTLKSLTAILESSIDEKTSEKDNSKETEKIILTIRKTAGKVSQTGQEIIKLVKAKG